MDATDTGYELDINPKTVCRLCLSQTNKLQNIFSNSIVDGYILSMPDILSYAIDINIKSDDQMPNKICFECKRQVINFYTFKQKSKRIEESLQSMFTPDTFSGEKLSSSHVVCVLCNDTFETDNEFVEHVKTIHNEEIVEQQSEIVEYEIHDITENSNESILSNQNDSVATISEVIIEPPAKKQKQSLPEKQLPVKFTKLRSAVKRNFIEIEAKTPSTSRRATRSNQTMVTKIELTDDEESDEKQSVTEDEYECFLCAMSYADKAEYIEHCKTHDFYCVCCGKVLDNETDYLEHDCDQTEKDESITSAKNDLFCVPCNKRLRSSSQVDQHAKMHESMSLIINYIDYYPCHECRIIYITSEKLSAHIIDVHESDTNELQPNEEKKIKFKKIDETCTDYQFLDEDKDEDVYKEGPYSCGDCKATYPSATELKYHAILHADTFPCPIFECGCQYEQLSRLSIHVMNKHINTKNLQCLHCNEAFNTYDNLQAHLKNDCREKKFGCHECDKKFFSKKALVTHLKTLKDKKYECKICGKSFKQQGELTIHNRSHTNERPFQCTICAKAYKTSSMRAAHMDSHISGKTFECSLCDKKLQSRTSYRNHMKRHTEEKKHTCETCGKKFFTRYHLKLHASKVHQKIKDNEMITSD